MGLLEAFILGLIQGLTEFLPVSSSGHIELGKALFGDGNLDENALLFTLVLHVATAISTVIVFWQDIIEIIKGLFSFKWNAETKFSYYVVLSMIPAGLVGLTMKDWIEEFFGGRILFVGSMLLLTGFVLYVSDRVKGKNKELNGVNVLVIGIAQAIAIMPGISRSGSTIATGVMLGVDREKVARFSFLMVLPLIFGAMASEVMDSKGALAADPNMFWPTTIGFMAALVSGYLACKWMIAIVKRSQLKYFSYYCWVVGIVAIAAALI